MLIRGILALLLCLAAGPVAGAPGVEPLRPGATLERRLSGGEAHRYSIPLQHGDLLRAAISQDEVDVVATLRDPEGREVLRADAMTGLASPETVSFVAEG